MKTGWQTRFIEDVCEVVNGGTPKTGVSDYWGGGHQWVTPAEMGKRSSPYIAETDRTLTDAGIANSSARALPPMSVILSSRAPIGHLVVNTEPMSFNQGCKGLIPGPGLHYKYLYYFLYANVELLNSLGTGATFKELSSGKLKSVQISFPALEEQEEIVAILDEAIKGITKVAANAECNLKNARELFDAVRKTLFDDERIAFTPLGSACDNLDSRRIPITKRDRKPGSVPYYGASGIVDYVADWIFDEDLLLVSEDGANLLARTYPIAFSVSGKCWVNNHAHVLCFASRVQQSLVEYFLNSISLAPWVSGMAQPKLNQRALNSIPVPVCTDDVAATIVARLDELSAGVEQARRINEDRMRLLADLRQSLLHRAFSGELTSAKKRRPSVKAVILEGTTSPQYTADVLAFAYSKHRTAQRDRTFGRVKGQKVLHLVEATAGVDLGRDPIKDAAGPNDSAHMRRAEDWAAQHGYFTFEAREGGYDFKTGPNFEKTLAAAYARLSSHKDAIAKVIDLLVPMDSQEAEVVATVHAAWNNLIIDGIESTRDAIVAEARENWAPSKLEIPKAKFEKAIRFIRQNDIIPDGSAKPVRARQESLL